MRDGHPDAAIDRAVRRGDHRRALRLLKEALERRPGSPRLALQLAEVLARAGHRAQAANVLCALAEAFARDGFTAKAIATLKRVQAVDRRRPEAERRLAELILVRGRELAGAADAPSKKSPSSIPVGSPLFAGIGVEELVAAIGGLELQTLAPGEVVFTEGELGDSLYVLAGGVVDVLVRDERGEDRKVRTLSDGDFFGEVALVDDGRRTATVRAAGECEVLKLDQQTVAALAERFPAIPRVVESFARMRSGSAEELEARFRAELPPEAGAHVG